MKLKDLNRVLKDYEMFGYGNVEVIIKIGDKEHVVNFAKVTTAPNEKVEITYD